LWGPVKSSTSVEEVTAIINSVWLFMVMTQIIYHTFFVWQYGGTLGKIAMGIEVVELQSGNKPRFAVAFNRAIFRIISGMIFYLGFVWALFDSKLRPPAPKMNPKYIPELISLCHKNDIMILSWGCFNIQDVRYDKENYVPMKMIL